MDIEYLTEKLEKLVELTEYLLSRDDFPADAKQELTPVLEYVRGILAKGLGREDVDGMIDAMTKAAEVTDGLIAKIRGQQDRTVH